ncbi:MAG: hypothetical protein KDC14_14155 [Planctomycetes bacterium]|nr:hypothetical protein [Planctomycetota bacterium]
MARQADALDVRWLLVGAEARDLVLVGLGAATSSRRTHDIDAAIQLTSWDEFHRLRDRLVRVEHAHVDPENLHRISFEGGVSIDLIPFGPIAQGNVLNWPPPDARQFDVTGLIEAQASSTEVRLADDFSVRLPALELQILLKLFAWRDRHLDRPVHDSHELIDLLRCIDSAIEDAEMYDDYFAVVERNDHDLELAKIELCGARLSRTLSEEARGPLVELLRAEIDEDGKLLLLREIRELPRAMDILAALLRGASQSPETTTWNYTDVGV